MSSLERAVDILRILAHGDSDGSRLQDIAEATGVARPSVHRLLSTMKELGIVEQDPATERYLLGLDLYLLGQASADRFNLIAMGRPIVEGLAADTGDTAYLTVRHRYDSICMLRAEGGYPIKAFTTQAGSRQPLGLGVGSIALLAFLEPETIEDVIQHNRAALQANDTFDLDALYRMVADTQANGYVVRKSTVVAGITTLAVPVRDHLGRPVASISLTAIESRLQDDRLQSVAQRCRAAATAMEQRLALQRRSGRLTPLAPAASGTPG